MEKALRKSIVSFSSAWGFDAQPADEGPTDVKDFVPSKAFEAFVAHYVLNRRHHLGLSRDDILSLVTGGLNDTAIDAIAIVANGMLIVDQEDLAVFEANDASDDTDVEFVFIQATMHAYLTKNKIDGFCTGVSNFISDTSRLEESRQIKYWRRLKERVLDMLERRGSEKKPKCTLYLAWPETRLTLRQDHIGTIDLRRESIDRSETFDCVDIRLVDGPELLELVNADRISNEAVLPFLRLGSADAADGDGALGVRHDRMGDGQDTSRVDTRTWTGVVRGIDLVDAVSDADGMLDDRAFYDNVRHFLGERKGHVNEAIAESIRVGDPRDFLLLNNGVTIVARHAMVGARRALKLTDFQIVNGCQTTTTLYRNRKFLSPELALQIKVVQTDGR